MLSEKYRPNNIAEFTKYLDSLDKAKIEQLKKTFINLDTKRILIYSEHHGIGKTTLAYSLANDLGYNIIELNLMNLNVALDELDVYDIYGRKNLLLVDDIDAILQSKRLDVNRLFKVKIPMILTCTDYWDKSMADIRKRVDKDIKLFQLRISKKSYINIIKNIARLVGVKDIDGLEHNYPDIRAALNDLELIISIGAKRKVNQNIFDILGTIFNSKRLRNYRSVLQYLHENLIYSDYQSMLPIIETNIITSYRSLGLLWAYRYLSYADIYMRRANHGMGEYVPRMIAAISILAGYYVPSKYTVRTDYQRYYKEEIEGLHMSSKKFQIYRPLFNLINK